ncbi:MAG: hypothetical protein ACI910_002159 [Oleispira sp.]|jgi:hypothetical protein
MINQASHRAGLFMRVNNNDFYYLSCLIKHLAIILYISILYQNGDAPAAKWIYS